MSLATCSMRGGLMIGIWLLVVSLAAPSRATAQGSSGGTEESVKVVAHIELPGMHVNEMFVQNRDHKHYLYLHRPVRKAFAVVDVSNPRKPVLVDRATLSQPPQGRVDVSSAEPLLAIAVTPEDNAAVKPAKGNAGSAAAAVLLPTETVRLLDLGDPKHPKALKTFTGVTSFLPDDNRRLIYIVNQEGLWIVSHRQTQPMPFCTSTDALMQDPNCQ